MEILHFIEVFFFSSKLNTLILFKKKKQTQSSISRQLLFKKKFFKNSLFIEIKSFNTRWIQFQLFTSFSRLSLPSRVLLIYYILLIFFILFDFIYEILIIRGPKQEAFRAYLEIMISEYYNRGLDIGINLKAVVSEPNFLLPPPIFTFLFIYFILFYLF